MSFNLFLVLIATILPFAIPSIHDPGIHARQISSGSGVGEISGYPPAVQPPLDLQAVIPSPTAEPSPLLQLTPPVFVPAAGSPFQGGIDFSILNSSPLDIHGHVTLVDREVSDQSVLLDEDFLIQAHDRKDFDVFWMPAAPGSHHLEAQVTYLPDSRTQPQTLDQEMTLNETFPDLQPDTFYLTPPYLAATLLLALLLTGVVVGSWIFLIKTISPSDEPEP
jgi:hypothetical protein